MKRNKLFLLPVALLLVLVCLFVMPAKANAASESDLTFTLNSDGESYSVTDCNTSASGSLEIPATYNSKPVTSIGYSAFAYCDSLTSITIPDSVTSIGSSAFTCCDSLTGIWVDEDNANYSSDARGVLFNKDKTILIQAPGGINGSYSIPDSVTSIGSWAFSECNSLTSVTIPDSVTRIGDSAFYNCSSLTSVTIPDSVTSIGEEVFLRCSSLTSVTIPDSVTSIGAAAFSGCDSLTSVTIGDSVTSIGRFAFYGCSSLTYNTYDNGKYLGNSENPYVALVEAVSTSITSCQIHEDTKIIAEYAFSGCRSLTSVTIPDSVTSIGDFAISDCSSLTSVTIPDSVTSIGYRAFYNCSSLTYNTYDNAKYLGNSKNPYVVLVEAVSTSISSCQIHEDTKVIGSFAFYNCSSLTSVTIPDSVTSIGSGAFWVCNSLTSVTIGDSVTSIGNSAFYNCKSLTSVTIGNGVTSIGSSAFYSCSSLADVYYSGTEEQWKAVTIDEGNDLLLNANIHYNEIIASGTCGENLTWELNGHGTLTISGTGVMKDFGDYGVEPWKEYQEQIKSVVIVEGVTSIGSHAFSGYSSLTSVTIPDSVSSIGSDAFYGCSIEKLIIAAGSKTVTSTMVVCESTLKEVVIPDSVTSIGHHAFCNCASLASITIPDSVTSIGDWAFACSGLTEITIPDSVIDIGDSAFESCASLISATIPDGVTQIGRYAFNWCDNLKFNVYDNAKYLGDAENPYHVLIEGTSRDITSIVIHEDTRIIGPDAFGNYTQLTNVAIPDNVTSIGFGAFSACFGLSSVTIGDGVKSIETLAFDHCNNLTEIAIPASVEKISDGAFCDNVNLMGIWVDENNPNYSSDSRGVLFNKEKTELVQTPGGIKGEYIISDTVNNIRTFAFKGCVGLSGVIIGNRVTGIGNMAFYGCNALTKISVPYSVTSIGYGVFSGCFSLEYKVYDNAKYLGNAENPYMVLVESVSDSIQSCAIYDGTKIICSSAFGNCVNLTSIIIPDSVSAIPDQAFYWCPSLTSITIPDSVTSISEDAFAGCDSLTNVYYCGTQVQWNAIGIGSGNDSLGLATLSFHNYQNDVCTICGGRVPYTVTFKNWDESILSAKTYYLGDKVTAPIAPTKAANNTYTYIFAGWDKTVMDCDGDATYTATYTSAYIDYTVVFKNRNGGLISSRMYHYGDEVFVPADPSKITDKTYIYTFIGWDKDITACVGDAVYTAIYKSTYIDYAVVFKDWNGDVLSSKTYHYGDTVVAPADPIRVEDADNTYTFAGWDKPVVNCAGDATYTAKYTETPKEKPVTGVNRVFGNTRYDTAFDAANMLKERMGVDKFDAIVVACGTDFADALSGSYLANQKNAPILLVRSRNQEINQVKAYINANLKAGGTVYLLGGVNAVPKAMETGLEGFTVKRLAGATRYETSLAIIQEVGVGNKDILVCTGKNFADGLSASAVNMPILLVKDSLTASQKAFLQGLNGNKIVIIGGTAAVNTRIENALKAYGTVERVEGATRYDTSVNIAKKYFPNAKSMVVAYANNFPDGLSGGPLAYSLDAPLILTMNGKQAAAVNYAREKNITSGMVLGGTSLVSDNVVRSLFSMTSGDKITVK